MEIFFFLTIKHYPQIILYFVHFTCKINRCYETALNEKQMTLYARVKFK